MSICRLGDTNSATQNSTGIWGFWGFLGVFVVFLSYEVLRMTFAEAGESRAWSCFWVVTAGSSRTRGRWFCMEAPSSDSAYCFAFFILSVQIFITELFKRDRLRTVR